MTPKPPRVRSSTQPMGGGDDFVPHHGTVIGYAEGTTGTFAGDDAKQEAGDEQGAEKGVGKGRVHEGKEYPAEQRAGGARPLGKQPGSEAEGDEMGRVGEQEAEVGFHGRPPKWS